MTGEQTRRDVMGAATVEAAALATMAYGARAAAYVDAFMQNIRWANAAALFERYSKET